MSDEELRCFVGGLSWGTDDRALSDAFHDYGAVDAKVVNDRETGRSRGFGFVTFNDKAGMDDAIKAMNGKELDGRTITVNVAQPRGSGGMSATVAEAAAARVAAAEAAGITLSAEVKRAFLAGRPVVALESTIICHGMPYPQNLQAAEGVEDIIRREGAVPATIAIIDGRPCIGLTASQLQHLARDGHSAVKAARRDVALVVSQGLTGATTVSATMLLSHKVGIPVFVTGGIGGVHRRGEITMDISSDLTELARTPVAVVCAGVKSVLDIPRTLEYLETQGVTVVVYGAKEFPAFFTPTSGCPAPATLSDPASCAALIDANHRMHLSSGMVIAVPVPHGQAAEAEEVERATQQALTEAEAQGVKGAQVTPFVLKRIKELTGGASLTANIALVKNNARVGAQIARALSQRRILAVSRL
ncbi:unnamed protein product [Closterium sp. Naga37s-1]|nr:unnamed protein product [Closterium sp. Naga37s-1]